jgi:hypothetical protein
MQESLVLSDVRLADAISDVLRTLALPETDYNIDWAMDYPGQQLAVDLYAGNEADLKASVELVRSALKDRLGIDARPSAELDAEILLLASA